MALIDEWMSGREGKIPGVTFALRVLCFSWSIRTVSGVLGCLTSFIIFFSASTRIFHGLMIISTLVREESQTALQYTHVFCFDITAACFFSYLHVTSFD